MVGSPRRSAASATHSTTRSSNPVSGSTRSSSSSIRIGPTPWSGRAEVERDTASWVHWYNSTRIHHALDKMPSIEFCRLRQRDGDHGCVEAGHTARRDRRHEGDPARVERRTSPLAPRAGCDSQGPRLSHPASTSACLRPDWPEGRRRAGWAWMTACRGGSTRPHGAGQVDDGRAEAIAVSFLKLGGQAWCRGAPQGSR